jgi:RimJ/RimL family protein N-acetyltransferase
MITRSFDPILMQSAVKLANNPNNTDIDYEEWLANTRNMMFHEDGNIGIATYEYPGVYTLHWFFLARGREAIDLAKRMLDKFFSETDCQTIRGLTPVDNKAARFLARKIGLTSYGVFEFLNGPCELFCMTRSNHEGNK